MSGAEAPVADLDERRRALEPGGSFIVQAPAGSGKTELLIQRYLMLLSRVERPEEIAAITFTRKAAAEMRRRVLDALAQAGGGIAPDEPHRRLTFEHAVRALAQDARRGWGLEENPGRLRIQTIDALCASFTRQMPVLSAFGAQPETLDDASALFREAARETLALVDTDGDAAECVARLLSHLDNNAPLAEDLLARVLERRDQWLRNLPHGLDREGLERALEHECRAIVRHAADLLPRSGPLRLDAEAPAEDCVAFADRLLTRDGEWRRRSPEAQALAADEAAAEPLRRALVALRRLPSARYSEEQWDALGAIMKLLPYAVAGLKLAFAAHGQADFVEIAQRAIAALGEPEAPTDLMLALDYRIHHVLVDEFQDTSFTQYRLLEKLTQGWTDGDGRTLFLVGDPMQSIYRFREAEVGLFLKARREGLGEVRLEPLTLASNFRSQADIVRWVNETFACVLPAAEDIASGAVPYSPSVPVHASEGEGVTIHALFDGDAAAEAARVAALVAEARDNDPDGTIAVLVRSRGHLEAIVPALKGAGLRFRAIEIETLGHRQAIQDLLALTRALSHPADRAAWLAVFRAPWCGLTLADLHALAAGAARRAPATDDLFPETLAEKAPRLLAPDTRTIWELAHDADRLGALSADGRARLQRTCEALAPAMAHRLRSGLRARVEAAWLGVGAPACIPDDTDLEDVDIYLDHLDRCEEAGDIADFPAFEQSVAALYALPDVHASPGDVQILTIHKAKGLEFDTVIVPGLGVAPRQRDPALFLWVERPMEARGESGLLLAPMREAGGERDPIYDYIARLDREKESHEDGRLLYVAATRARRRLHLLGDVRLVDARMRPPAPGSLLEKLWPGVAGAFETRMRGMQVLPGRARTASTISQSFHQELRRLPSRWRMPSMPASVSWKAPPRAPEEAGRIEFSWVGETARHVGSVVHRWLQRMADDELAGWDAARVEGLREAFRAQLAARGVGVAELGAATERVRAALARALEHERGRWLLGPQADARNEYRLAVVLNGERRHLVVDRLFTDREGVRWIVDYKTSSHEGADAEAFLDRERERYRAQLEGYLAALAPAGGPEGEPMGEHRLGLYFPLLSGWREWRGG